MKNILLKFGLIFLLFTGIFTSVTPPSFAVNSHPQNLSETIDHFLTSLPSDYYTIRNTAALKTIVKSDHALLIDVRQPPEYHSGHIPGAINIPLQTLTTNFDQIPRDRPVILYCTTGYRSAMGVMTLQMLEYTNVRAFSPSIEGWKNAGEPLEKTPINSLILRG